MVSLLAFQSPAQAFAVSPPYAVTGAFASYTAEGGFIPYFAGVEGNITYTVTSIFENGSMGVHVFVNITAGSELNPFVTTYNVTDITSAPVTFPAVPLAGLASGHVEFENVSASFLKNDTIFVPAGTFTTMEFQGVGANNTSTKLWFDPLTGLMIEGSSGTSAMQLDSSNIAVPTAPPSGLSGEIPYELTFVLAFTIGGVLFWYIRHHYTSAAAKKAKEKSSSAPTVKKPKASTSLLRDHRPAP